MQTYRVLLSGANLFMEIDGEPGRFGFEVARYVDAASPREAAKLALSLVHEAPQLKHSALNLPSDPPLCRVDEVEPLAPGESAPERQPGFAFYPQDPDA